MKKLKLILVFALCFGAIISASAQITTGEPSAKKIRTGNRPEAGDFGLYMGATSTMFKGMFESDFDVKALPLLNFKYMASDQVELRLGLELYETSERLRGDYSTEEYGNIHSANMKLREGESSAMIYPGFAYHFSRKNLLDVYCGIELPLGWNSATLLDESSSDSYSNKTTKRAFTIGVGAFIGVQAFVANLPLAIGVEYGLSSRFDAGLKYKNEYTENGKTQVYYSPSEDSRYHYDYDDYDFTKLKAKKGTIGNQIRVTLSYYFK